jgi:signal transduction histidine kinase
MSPGGVLINLRIPSSRIAIDMRNTQLFLFLSLIITTSITGIFAYMAFRLERRNILALDQARRPAATKSQFLANMSHEI